MLLLTIHSHDNSCTCKQSCNTAALTSYHVTLLDCKQSCDIVELASYHVTLLDCKQSCDIVELASYHVTLLDCKQSCNIVGLTSYHVTLLDCKQSCDIVGLASYHVTLLDCKQSCDIVVVVLASNHVTFAERNDWKEDNYWTDQEDNFDNDWDDYYNRYAKHVYFSVNEDNFLARNLPGGFRFRIGDAADNHDINKVKLLMKSSDGLHPVPSDMVIDKKVYEVTCNLENNGPSSTEKYCNSEDDWNDEDVYSCKPALYGFVSVTNASCYLNGRYVLRYRNINNEFEVHVKFCGHDDWDEYESDYLYADTL